MREYICTVVKNVPIAVETFLMELEIDRDFAFDFKPGQFLHIEIPNAPQMILRRPISVHSSHEGRVSLIYIAVGKGTKALSSLKKGDALKALGPVGNGFPILDGAKKVYFLGGGCGFSPLQTLMRSMEGAQFTSFFGWKDVEHVVNNQILGSFGDVCVYTEDGSIGEKGYALTGLLEQIEIEKPDVVYACGPTPMLKALSGALPKDIPCYVSLEERMGCGMGACLACTCSLKNGEKARVCVDGPVFNLREVSFK